MAEIRLGQYEVQEQGLPFFCVKCGQPADLWKRKRFAWRPTWTYWIGGVIAMMVMTKRMTVELPMCQAHKNHWFVRNVISIGGLLGVFGLLAILIALIAVNQPPNPRMEPVFEGLAVVFLVGFLGWLITLFELSATQIRPTEITANSITLTGVSPDFEDAVYEQRNLPRDERPQKKKRRKQYDDDGPLPLHEGE